MKAKKWRLTGLSFLLLLAFLALPSALAQESDSTVCAVYITGIGCPNCAVTDPSVLSEFTSRYPDLVIIEYEIYDSRASNQNVASEYFKSYVPLGRAGVPFIILNKDQTGLGRFEVLDAEEMINSTVSNGCPMPDGSSVPFEEIDITGLPGKINIWTDGRVLHSGPGGNNEFLKSLIKADNITTVLEQADFKVVNPSPVPISGAELEFESAAKIGDWTLQWHGDIAALSGGVEFLNGGQKDGWSHWYWLLIVAAILGLLYLFYRIWLVPKNVCICLTEAQKNWLIIGASVLFLILFFMLAKNLSPKFLEKAGYTLPLPVFTFFIALVDGFNPCNLFVITFLLGLLVSASHSKKRIYAVGYTFVVMVFIIYFLFMAAWLNIFKYIGFITPLRIAIAVIALGAGLINCKELLFFRRGITLMIQEQHKKPLSRRIEAMKETIKKASMPVLITSSIGLAAFASLVELPCTAGFPIIYTGILSGKVLGGHFWYYTYLAIYNLVYVIPLAVVIALFTYTFRARQISQRQMQIIKFIGGLIMLLLGLILLVNPSLIGIGMA